LTFGSLARFIAQKTSAISFEPTTVLARECRPAGVFLGIRRLVKEVAKDGRRFAPSSRIHDVLRGHALDDFWTQLRWMTEDRIPQLPAFWREVTGWAFGIGCLGAIAALVASLTTGNVMYLIASVAMASCGFYAASLYNRWTNPLPPHLRTFRDLCMFVAGLECDATRAGRSAR
jgi:hypothetical protein